MIEIFEKPRETRNSQIDRLYDGYWVAYQRTSEMFSDGWCYVVAIGDDTDELFRYVRELRKKTGIPGGVRAGDNDRGDDPLYAE